MLHSALRLVAAAFSGLMLFASFQPTGLWWSAPLGMALFFLVLNTRNAILASWIQGAVLYALLLPWVGEFVGWYAWIALAAIQSLYSLLFGVGARFLIRRPEDNSRWAVTLSSVGLAAWYVATEWLRSSWPFGGFPWGRLAWGQVGGPLAWWIQWGGPALVTFVVVISGAALAWLLWALGSGRAPFFRRHQPPVSRWEMVVPSVVALVLTVGIGGAISLEASMFRDQEVATNPARSVRIAAIQGNVPRLGLDFAAQRQAVLDNHARQTSRYADHVATGEEPQPDLVFWPENASDVNPFTNPNAANIIQGSVNEIQAPILVGTVSPEHNSMYVWGPDGPGDVHEKKYLQPFGEYMPLRDVLRKITPLVDRAGDFQPGEDNGAVVMTPFSAQSAHLNPVTVGVATCYEISFDGATRDAVRGGAELLSTPTNNATFGFTDMTYQQLAMSRMRAMEYNRSLVVAATSGVSAIVLPDGTVEKQSHIFEATTLTATVPLHNNMTISALVGPWVERGIAILGLLAVAVGFSLARAELAASTKKKKPQGTARKKTHRTQLGTSRRK